MICVYDTWRSQAWYLKREGYRGRHIICIPNIEAGEGEFHDYKKIKRRRGGRVELFLLYSYRIAAWSPYEFQIVTSIGHFYAQFAHLKRNNKINSRASNATCIYEHWHIYLLTTVALSLVPHKDEQDAYDISFTSFQPLHKHWPNNQQYLQHLGLI